jgi:hypothetical protein
MGIVQNPGLFVPRLARGSLVQSTPPASQRRQGRYWTLVLTSLTPYMHSMWISSVHTETRRIYLMIPFSTAYST